MFRPITLFIGLRYARAKSRQHFISLVSLASMLGIAMGMTVLITVLSVVNGFDKEIRKQIFDIIPPISILSFTGAIENWQSLEQKLAKFPGIKNVAPFINQQAMLMNNQHVLPVMLVGILPEQEKKVTALSHKMIGGNITNLKPEHWGIVIGSELAKQLHIKLGDTLTITTLQNSISIANITPQFKTLRVEGIFKAGGGGMRFDEKIAFIHLRDAQILTHMPNRISGFHLTNHDIFAAPQISERLQETIGNSMQVWNWTEQLGDLFDNIRMTKTLMFFIFILIIAVAVFNLVCTMIMVVKNKQADIAILRTLGATPFTILAIFLVQATLIAASGIMLGLAGGLALASHISALSSGLQTLLHMQLISSNVYFVNYLPAKIEWLDVCRISLAAFLLSLLAAIYPAFQAARLDPVNALNNE